MDATPVQPPGGGLAAASASADAADITAEIAQLPNLDLDELRVRWRRLLRTPPPDHLPRNLFMRLLAYRIQARRFGDLDRETARFLDRLARDSARRRAADVATRNPKAPPPIPPVPANRSLKVGALLAREFGGAMHVVTVVPGGYAWNGSVYDNLSQIARLITGTRWNGPRFFGLRDRAASAEPAAEASGP
jgi:hypothetical protein